MSLTKQSDAYEDHWLREFAQRENDYLHGDERYRQWCEEQKNQEPGREEPGTNQPTTNNNGKRK